jgi:hypothetical protein
MMSSSSSSSSSAQSARGCTTAQYDCGRHALLKLLLLLLPADAQTVAACQQQALC